MTYDSLGRRSAEFTLCKFPRASHHHQKRVWIPLGLLPLQHPRAAVEVIICRIRASLTQKRKEKSVPDSG